MPPAVLPAALPAVVRQAQPTHMPHVVYIATAGLLLLVVAIFAVMLMLQRRRRRAQILLALAAEEAERRRKKRRRAGLRSAEIERYCPELIVVPPGTISRDVSDDDDTDRADTDVADTAEDEPADLAKAKAPPSASARLKEKQESLALEDVRSADSQPDESLPLPIELEEGNEVCVVCLDDMVVDERVRRLPCSHVYHSSCIRLWLRRKNACPCCCKTVVKRKKKKKKPRVNLNPGRSSSNNLTDHPPLPDLPVEPPRAASFSGRRPHRTPSGVRIFAHSRSMPCVDPATASHVVNVAEPSRSRDRPRPPARAELFPRTASDAFSRPGANPFPRTGSLLDPDDPNSEALNSEASSHFDEHMASQLLDQVRQVLRGEIGVGDEYSTDGEMSDACLEFHEDDDSLLLENVQLNNPFRGHAASIGVPRSNISRDVALTRQRQHSRFRQGPGEMEENMAAPQRITRNV